MPTTRLPSDSAATANRGAAETATEPPVEPTDDPTDKPMPYVLECPVCGDTFERPQALNGHMRFSHRDLDDDELEELYEEAKEKSYYVEEQGQGEGQTQDVETRPAPEQTSTAGPSGQGASFDWEQRLERLEDLRSAVEDIDESFSPFGVEIRRDEGCREALEALDEIEMEVRERLGASEKDPRLRKRIDESLEQIAGLVRAREQREAIEERFSGEKAERRVERLNNREAEIRKHIRDEWGAGKPIGELKDEDPVLDLHSSDSGGSNGGSGTSGPGSVFS